MKRHSTDAVSLVFGIAFVLIAGWWALVRVLHSYDLNLNVPHIGWFLAGGLILLGLLGVAASLRRGNEPVSAAPAAVTAEPVTTETVMTDEPDVVDRDQSDD
jgi:hypothetical protein